MKVFNNIYFGHLASLARAAGTAERSVLAIAGDDEAAKQTITQFLDSIGYDAYDVGPLAEGWRSSPTPRPTASPTSLPAPNSPVPDTGRPRTTCATQWRRRSAVATAEVRPALLAERRDDVHDGRAEQHDEQRRQDAEDQREDHLDRDLHRLLLGPLPPLEPHLLRLGAQHVGDGDAVRVGLDDGAG